MGSSKSTQKTTFDQAGQEERAARAQYQNLGNEQNNFLLSLLNGGQDGAIAKSFDAAKQRFSLAGKDYADYLATTRGLNKSDTPVSQQAMERYGLGMADLESQQANMGLNYGFNATQALPAGTQAVANPLFQERMASGTTTMKHNPSLMSQISQGMSLGSQAIGLGAQIGGLAMMPGLGGAGSSGLSGLTQFTQRPPAGMGSGASANYWFGNYGR